jgi:hypothetical protein
VLALAGALAVPAAAADFRGGDTILIGSDEVVDDDLFISAQNVTVNGTVNGNLFVAGNQVDINGAVNGSLFIAGELLRLNGPVAGSAYLAGAGISLGPQASIVRNLMAGGYSLRTEAGSRVGRDLLAGAYQAQLAGWVGRDARLGANAVELNGTVERSVEVAIGEPNTDLWTYTPYYNRPGMPPAIASGLHINPSAVISGKLTYYSTVDQSAGIAAAPAGGVVFRQTQARSSPSAQARANEWIGDQVREFLTLLILGLCAVWLLPTRLNSLADYAQSRPLADALWGALIIVAGFALTVVVLSAIVVSAIVLGIISLGGLAWVVFGIGLSALGLAFTTFMLLVAYGAELVVAYLAGKLVLRAVAKNYAEQRIWAMLVGLVLYTLVVAIPVLGGVVHLAATLIGLGAMAYAVRPQRPGTVAPTLATA